MLIMMNTNNTLFQNIQNASATAIINSHFTAPNQPFVDDNDMKHILTYALPLSCLAIVIVVIITIGIHRRHRVLENWTSLKRMRNTNPRFIERTGLRRDSEYDSYSDGVVNVTVINNDGQFQKEPEAHLATIT
jgi:hypothetical protein